MAKRQNTSEATVMFEVPYGVRDGMLEAFEAGVKKAAKLFFEANKLPELSLVSETVAEFTLRQAQLGAAQLEDLIARKTTVKRILDEVEWILEDDIVGLLTAPPQICSGLLKDWKRRGEVFSVTFNGKELYARYQFDALGQPLPVIHAVIQAYGEYTDPWSLAAWFHFPNGWIVGSGQVPIAPKDALHRCDDVVNAARQRRGSYVA